MVKNNIKIGNILNINNILWLVSDVDYKNNRFKAFNYDICAKKS